MFPTPNILEWVSGLFGTLVIRLHTSKVSLSFFSGTLGMCSCSFCLTLFGTHSPAAWRRRLFNPSISKLLTKPELSLHNCHKLNESVEIEDCSGHKPKLRISFASQLPVLRWCGMVWPKLTFWVLRGLWWAQIVRLPHMNATFKHFDNRLWSSFNGRTVVWVLWLLEFIKQKNFVGSNQRLAFCEWNL